MSNLSFDCPHCKQSLEAPEDLAGNAIECPSCKGSIVFSKPTTAIPTASQNTQSTGCAIAILFGLLIVLIIYGIRSCGSGSSSSSSRRPSASTSRNINASESAFALCGYGATGFAPTMRREELFCRAGRFEPVGGASKTCRP